MPRFETIDGPFGTLVHTDDVHSLDLDQVVERYQETGAVLFRGHDPGLAGFEAFTRRFGSQFLVHGNPDRQRVSEDDTTQEVQPGQFPIPLHVERGSTPFPPDMFWFYCKEPAAAGGETIVCDGVALRAALCPATLELLSSRQIRWVNQISATAWRRAYGIVDVAQASAALDQLAPAIPGLRYRFREDETLHLEHLVPAIRRPRHGAETAFANSLLLRDTARPMYYATFEDGSPIPDSLYAELQTAAAPLTVPIPWRTGDVLMLDNSRVMHGRNAFADPGRRIYVRMCQSAY